MGEVPMLHASSSLAAFFSKSSEMLLLLTFVFAEANLQRERENVSDGSLFPHLLLIQGSFTQMSEMERLQSSSRAEKAPEGQSEGNNQD